MACTKFDFVIPNCARAAAVRGLLARAILRAWTRFSFAEFCLADCSIAGRNTGVTSARADGESEKLIIIGKSERQSIC